MSAQDDLIKQILASSDKSKWSGQGYGSAEKNAADMARIMAGIGITDVKQFGKVDKYEPVEQIGMTLNGQPVQGSGSEFYVLDSVDTGDGTEYVRRNLNPEEAKQVKPVYGVPTGYDENTQPTYRNVDVTKVKEKDGQLFGATGQTFGNKATGQEVPNTYTERQTGNFFGGTYEGKGNTGYGVQFDQQGNPIFYTQGASSSDLNDFAPLLTLASFVPGLQPFAMAANAAIAAKQGNPLGVITNLAGMGGLAGISGMSDIANAAKYANVLKSGDPLAILMAGANAGGVTDVGGFDLKDISKTIGGIKALQSGDPLAMLRYGMDAIPKSDGLTSSFGPGNMDEFRENLIPGMFKPGSGGYSPSSDGSDGTDSGPGYYDEITGKFVSDPLGGLQNPLGPETGNFDPNQEWEYSLTKPGVWTNKDGEEIDVSYMPDRGTAQTGGEIMRKAGVMPSGANKTAPTKSAPAAPAKPDAPTTPATSSGMDLSGLMSLLGGQQQQQTVQQAPMQDPYAHIKLMEELFGPNIDLTPAGENTSQRK
jgi:hypothetical protein